MFGTIVVGVDESGSADHAVQAVTRIAQATGDKVVVFHGVVLHASRAMPYTTETRDEAQHLVDRYVKQLSDAGITATGEVHRELEIGVGGALIDVAADHQAGLLVVGTRGRSNLASMCSAAWPTRWCTSHRCPFLSSRRRPPIACARAGARTVAPRVPPPSPAS